MSVINDLENSYEEGEQRKDLFQARSLLEMVGETILEANVRIQAIVDSGRFDTIPLDLKRALNRWWTIFKDAQKAAEADGEIVEIYRWRK